MQWVSQNPPPAHIFLISGDKDFAGMLHRLRMSNYNILLAGTPCDSSAVVCSASSIMWNWCELARGENFSGRHFNQPPDGPFNSWYGHYRGPLEDPFEIPVQKNSSKVNDSSDEEMSDKGHPAVHRTLLKQIRRIVNSYPYGVSITELRGELTKSQVNIDREHCSHKKFSRFLLSIPHIVKAVPAGNGALILHPVSPKVKQTAQSDVENSVTKNGIQAAQMSEKSSDRSHSATRMIDIEPVVPVSSFNDTKERATEQKREETSERKMLNTSLREHQAASTKKLHAQVVNGFKAEERPETNISSLSEDEVASTKDLCPEEKSDAQVVTHPVAPEEKNPKTETGFLSGIWRKWFSRTVDSEETKHDIPDKFHASTSSAERLTSEEHKINAPSLSSSSAELSMNTKSSLTDKSEVSQGLVAKIMSWFRPWRSESHVNTINEQSNEEHNVIEISTKHLDDQYTRHELFYDESFWSDVESFLRTSSGLHIFLNSTSREQFARRLQTDGPLVVRSLQEADLLHLVDLLISEKKWIKEFPSKTPHFGVVLPPERSSVSARSSKVNPSLMQTKPSENTRIETLSDCKHLLDELLQKHPDGFSTGFFRKQFLEKFGYSLDYRKLGYLKLESLIQIMPGVKIESLTIFPDTVVYAPGIGSLGSEAKSSGSDGKLTDLFQKHVDIESQWEDLGPVLENSNIGNLEKGLDQNRVNNVYEPCTSNDDVFSDIEEEGSLTCTRVREQSITKVNKDQNESSLLQILDSWYKCKDESRRNDHTSNFLSSEICPEEKASPSRSSYIGEKNHGVSITANRALKQKLRKSYTFVSDTKEV